MDYCPECEVHGEPVPCHECRRERFYALGGFLFVLAWGLICFVLAC